MVPVQETPNVATGTGGGGIKVPALDQEVARQQAASNAIQGAETEQGNALAAQSAAEAMAREHGAAQMQIQQEKIKALQAQRDADVQRINEDQQRVYDEAHKTTIPDFYDGSSGRHVAAAISMALGEAGRGLTAFATGANVGNTAKDVIDNQIRLYATQQKEKIDNLFKYAAARNQLGEEQKANWASKLNDLQFQMAALHQSVADHVLEVSAAAKGRVDQAQAQVLAQTQQQASVNLQDAARQRAYENQIQKRKLGIEGFNAQTARIAAVAQKEAAANEKAVKSISAEFDKDESRLMGTARAPGLIMKQQGIRELGNGLREAIATNDPDKIAPAVAAVKEQIARFNTGAAPSHQQMQLLDDLTSDPSKTREKISRLLGSTEKSKQTLTAIVNLVDQSDEHAVKQIDAARQGLINKYQATGRGIASTSAQAKHVEGRLGGLFGTQTVRTPQGEVPRYGEGGAAQTHTAPASQYPVGTRATSGGKPIVWNGSVWEAAK
jgi:hypothetical protein